MDHTLLLRESWMGRLSSGVNTERIKQGLQPDNEILKNAHLPLLMAVGDEGVGKSLHLNRLIGRNVLPVGTHLTTRRPVYIKLRFQEPHLVPRMLLELPDEASIETKNENIIHDLLVAHFSDMLHVKMCEAVLTIFSSDVPNVDILDLPGFEHLGSNLDLKLEIQGRVAPSCIVLHFVDVNVPQHQSPSVAFVRAQRNVKVTTVLTKVDVARSEWEQRLGSSAASVALVSQNEDVFFRNFPRKDQYGIQSLIALINAHCGDYRAAYFEQTIARYKREDGLGVVHDDVPTALCEALFGKEDIFRDTVSAAYTDDVSRGELAGFLGFVQSVEHLLVAQILEVMDNFEFDQCASFTQQVVQGLKDGFRGPIVAIAHWGDLHSHLGRQGDCGFEVERKHWVNAAYSCIVKHILFRLGKKCDNESLHSHMHRYFTQFCLTQKTQLGNIVKILRDFTY